MLVRPTVLLRLEGVALLAASVTAYALVGGSWWLFALLLFVPDLSMLAYAGGPRIGAAIYNIVHSTTLPLLLAVAAVALNGGAVVPFALVWLAHVGLDRGLGYGLKRPTSFGDTHLGRIGRSR